MLPTAGMCLSGQVVLWCAVVMLPSMHDVLQNKEGSHL